MVRYLPGLWSDRAPEAAATIRRNNHKVGFFALATAFPPLGVFPPVCKGLSNKIQAGRRRADALWCTYTCARSFHWVHIPQQSSFLYSTPSCPRKALCPPCLLPAHLPTFSVRQQRAAAATASCWSALFRWMFVFCKNPRRRRWRQEPVGNNCRSAHLSPASRCKEVELSLSELEGMEDAKSVWSEGFQNPAGFTLKIVSWLCQNGQKTR